MIDKNKQYTTRSGLAVRIYATDCGGDYPVHGAILEDDEWHVNTWTSDGKHVTAGASSYDLIEVKPRIKKAYWVNIYKHGIIGGFHETKNEADLHAKHGRYACVKFEIDCEEGEGL